MSQKDQKPVLGRQIAAARSLIGIGQAELASQASISVPTLKRMEAADGPAAGMPNNVKAVVDALETYGIVFIPENGGGAGVRLLMPKLPSRDSPDASSGHDQGNG